MSRRRLSTASCASASDRIFSAISGLLTKTSRIWPRIVSISSAVSDMLPLASVDRFLRAIEEVAAAATDATDPIGPLASPSSSSSRRR